MEKLHHAYDEAGELEQTLAKIERMLEKHLEFPVDYLPSAAEVMSGE